MLAGFETYYRRITIFNIFTGLAFIVSGVLFQISNPIFFLSIAIFYVVPPFLRPKTTKVSAFKSDRKKILQEHKGLTKLVIVLVYIWPLIMALIAYCLFDKKLAASGLIFVGLFALSSVVAHRIFLPFHRNRNSESLK